MTEDRIAAELSAIRQEAQERHVEYLDRFAGLGDAIGGARGEIRSVCQALDHHIALDDLRFSGVEERFRTTHSDHRELKGRVDAVDETGRQAALSMERAKALTVHLGQEGERLQGWRKSLVLLALTLVCALLGFALRGLLGI